MLETCDNKYTDFFTETQPIGSILPYLVKNGLSTFQWAVSFIYGFAAKLEAKTSSLGIP